jgi:uncharacterized DUF497 family protein
MRVTFDPAKRAKTLAVCGLDFEGAFILFQDRHVFSMRKGNDREKALLAPYFEI